MRFYVDPMFEMINGLPLHPLVVHATVVLLPLMAVATLLVALVPRWRQVAVPWIVAANLVVVVIAFITKQSGESLEEMLGEQSAAIDKHANYGDLLPWFAVALLVASVLLWIGVRSGGPLLAVAILLVGVAAIGSIGWTYLTGDSGAQSVWSDAVSSTGLSVPSSAGPAHTYR